MRKISLLIIASFLIIGQSFAQTKKGAKKNNSSKQHNGNSSTTTGDGMPTEEKPTLHKETLYLSSIDTDKGTKYGYVDQYKKLIIPHIYDYTEGFYENFAIVHAGGFCGTIDTLGSFIIPLNYTDLTRFQSNYLLAKKINYCGIIDFEGKEILPLIYDRIESYSDEVLRRNTLKIEYHGKIGLFDFEQKKWLINPIHSDVFYSTYCIFAINKGYTDKIEKVYIYNKYDYSIIDSSYSDISPVYQGSLSQAYLIVTKNNLQGIVNYENKIIAPIIYQKLRFESYKNNYLTATKNYKSGIITFDNKVLIDFIYDKIEYHDSYSIVSNNNLYGIIDMRTFKETVPCIYKDIFLLNEKLFFSKKDDLYIEMKYTGDTINNSTYQFPRNSYYYKKDNKFGFRSDGNTPYSEAKFDTITLIKPDYRHRYFCVTSGKTKLLLDNKSNITAEVSDYDDVYNISNSGYIIVSKNNKCGIIKKITNEIVVPIQYEMIGINEDGIFYIIDHGHYYKLTINDAKTTITEITNTTIGLDSTKNLKLSRKQVSDHSFECGYVDSKDSILIPRIYDYAEEFHNGVAIVSIGNFYGAIDRSGAFIIPLKYSYLTRYQSNYLIAQRSNYYGIIDKTGKIILPFIYDQIQINSTLPTGSNLAIQYQGKSGIFDIEQKNWLIPPRYTRFFYSSNIFATDETVSPSKTDIYSSDSFTIIDSTLSKISFMNSNYIIAIKNHLTGAIDGKNTILIPFIYESLSHNYSHHTYLIAKQNNKYGVVSFENKILINFLYDKLDHKENICIVKQNNLYGIVDMRTYKETVPCIYEDIITFNDTLIFAKKGNYYGRITSTGELIDAFTYTFPGMPKNYYGNDYNYYYTKGDKSGFVYSDLLSEALYDTITILKISNQRRYYLGNSEKNISIFNDNFETIANISKYDNVTNISATGYLVVLKDNRYGIISQKKNKVILPTKYEMILIDDNDNLYVMNKGAYYTATFSNDKKVTLTPITN